MAGEIANAPPADLVALLARHAGNRPQATCLIFQDEAISFAAFDARVGGLARALAGAGVGAGDRVLILAPAGPVFFELLFACARIGAIMVPVNARLSDREVSEIVADAEPALALVASDRIAGLDLAGVRTVVAAEDHARWRDAASATPRAHAVAPDDVVLILYTSGTTARPKGVMLSHRNLSYLERMARELWGFSADSVNLAAMPLFHIGGIGYGLLAFSQGGVTVLTRETEPVALLALMTRHRITHTFLVPTLIQRLVDQLETGGMEPPRVAHMVYGAAPIGETLLRRAIAAFGSSFHHAYGMTETAGTVVTLDPDDHDPDGPRAARLRSCGRPMPWVELRLVDPADGRVVGVGEVGEIRLRSPAITRGYWRKPRESAEAITTDGWLCSGDAATRDADGFIYLRDRYKDMIVSGGENIYPAEIDNVLQAHPAVQEVAVIGVPHERWGETPRAYVVLRPGHAAGEAELIAFARTRLAHYKCPTSVMFVDALPRNASGKILKRALRENG